MEQDFEGMSAIERIRYVQQLWDRIAANPADVPVSDPMKQELDRRLAEHRDAPGQVLDWEAVKAGRPTGGPD